MSTPSHSKVEQEEKKPATITATTDKKTEEKERSSGFIVPAGSRTPSLARIGLTFGLLVASGLGREQAAQALSPFVGCNFLPSAYCPVSFFSIPPQGCLLNTADSYPVSENSLEACEQFQRELSEYTSSLKKEAKIGQKTQSLAKTSDHSFKQPSSKPKLDLEANLRTQFASWFPKDVALNEPIRKVINYFLTAYPSFLTLIEQEKIYNHEFDGENFNRFFGLMVDSFYLRTGITKLNDIRAEIMFCYRNPYEIVMLNFGTARIITFTEGDLDLAVEPKISFIKELPARVLAEKTSVSSSRNQVTNFLLDIRSFLSSSLIGKGFQYIVAKAYEPYGLCVDFVFRGREAELLLQREMQKIFTQWTIKFQEVHIGERGIKLEFINKGWSDYRESYDVRDRSVKWHKKNHPFEPLSFQEESDLIDKCIYEFMVKSDLKSWPALYDALASIWGNLEKMLYDPRHKEEILEKVNAAFSKKPSIPLVTKVIIEKNMFAVYTNGKLQGRVRSDTTYREDFSRGNPLYISHSSSKPSRDVSWYWWLVPIVPIGFYLYKKCCRPAKVDNEQMEKRRPRFRRPSFQAREAKAVPTSAGGVSSSDRGTTTVASSAASASGEKSGSSGSISIASAENVGQREDSKEALTDAQIKAAKKKRHEEAELQRRRQKSQESDEKLEQARKVEITQEAAKEAKPFAVGEEQLPSDKHQVDATTGKKGQKCSVEKGKKPPLPFDPAKPVRELHPGKIKQPPMPKEEAKAKDTVEAKLTPSRPAVSIAILLEELLRHYLVMTLYSCSCHEAAEDYLITVRGLHFHLMRFLHLLRRCQELYRAKSAHLDSAIDMRNLLRHFGDEADLALLLEGVIAITSSDISLRTSIGDHSAQDLMNLSFNNLVKIVRDTRIGKVVLKSKQEGDAAGIFPLFYELNLFEQLRQCNEMRPVVTINPFERLAQFVVEVTMFARFIFKGCESAGPDLTKKLERIQKENRFYLDALSESLALCGMSHHFLKALVGKDKAESDKDVDAILGIIVGFTESCLKLGNQIGHVDREDKASESFAIDDDAGINNNVAALYRLALRAENIRELLLDLPDDKVGEQYKQELRLAKTEPSIKGYPTKIKALQRQEAKMTSTRGAAATSASARSSSAASTTTFFSAETRSRPASSSSSSSVMAASASAVPAGALTFSLSLLGEVGATPSAGSSTTTPPTIPKTTSSKTTLRATARSFVPASGGKESLSGSKVEHASSSTSASAHAK